MRIYIVWTLVPHAKGDEGTDGNATPKYGSLSYRFHICSRFEASLCVRCPIKLGLYFHASSPF